MLTSHRLLWIDAAASPAAGLSCSLPLSTVHSWETTKYSWAKKAPKLKLKVYEMADGHPAAGLYLQGVVYIGGDAWCYAGMLISVLGDAG